MRRVAVFFALGAALLAGKAALDHHGGAALTSRLTVEVPPNASEATIREAILVDFARHMNVDKADEVIRNHLARTMDFLEDSDGWSNEALQRRAGDVGLMNEDPIVRARLLERAREALESVTPEQAVDRGTLEAYLGRHADGFAIGPIIEFEHLFLSRQVRGAELSADAAALAAELSTMKLSVTDALARTDGALTVRPRERAPLRVIRTQHGEAIADALLSAPLGEWTGPVESPRGAHLLRALSRESRRVPSLDEIMPRVRGAVLAELRAANFERRYARLRERYQVTVACGSKAGPDGCEPQS